MQSEVSQSRTPIWYINAYMWDLEKAEEPEIKLPTFVGSWESKGIPEKHLLLLH